VRSRAAADLLAGAGFAEVYSLRGGIKAWQGPAAAGPPEQGLGLITGDETLARTLVVAYGLEMGLARFYREAAAQAPAGPTRELLAELAGLEQGHQARVWTLYAGQTAAPLDQGALAAQATDLVMEDGQEVARALAALNPGGLGPSGVLEMAMALETQALDLYLRLARKAGQADARAALVQLAQEEKAHLTALSQRLESLAG
jgi:rubrerythrin